MRKLQLACLLIASLGFLSTLAAQDDSYPPPSFAPEQLDNLLAPIALYPDPLLAQILIAATFPDQIDEAARLIRANADPATIDAQYWDVSVKAVAHYPMVLARLDDDLDWTTAVGQAYAAQPDDVMVSIQRLRQMAQSVGNLVTTPQEEVVDDNGYIEIWPAEPQYIFVPLYDPSIVFFGSAGPFGFSAAFPIGVWLNHDFDWRFHHVVYNGWDGGRGWVGRSRQYIHISNVYVDSRYKNVTVNRAVLQRPVNREQLNHYAGVHRQTNFAPAARTPVTQNVANPRPAVNNKVIERNINTSDSRFEALRGHETASSQPQPPGQTTPSRQASAPQPSREPSQSAFGESQGVFGARQSSQRGQESRHEMSNPSPPPPRAAPAPAPAPRSEPAAEGKKR